MERKNTFVNGLIERMSLEEKIGALLTLGFSGVIPRRHIYEFIEKYHCGGLRLSTESRVFGSYVDPKSNKTVVNVQNKTGYKRTHPAPVCTASEYKAVLDELQAVARRRPLSIPLHFSFDQEGGTSADFFFGGVNLFPKPMGLRATNDPHLAYEVGLAVARQSRAVGFSWVHSPVLDVNSDPRNPEIYTRSYSDRVEDVCAYAVETCLGLKDGGLIATGKHFPGRGHSDVDAHFQVPVIDVDRETMLSRELAPYRTLIEKGLLPSIMIAHSIFPAFDPENIATVSKPILTGLLRRELGFEGVITTDSMTMGAVATRYGVANACAMSLEAGADLVLMKAENQLVEETFAAIRSFVESGRIPMEALDEKVYRVLNLKYEYGLFFDRRDNDTPPEQIIADPAIRRLCDAVAQRSVLVARQKEGALPLREEERVLVVEQMVKAYNSFSWHPGILFDHCERYGQNVSYLETAYTLDEEDKRRIYEEAQFSDTVVATNYFIRGSLCNKEFWEEFIEKTGKKVVVLTNTPYEEISIPRNAENVVVTFATSPANIRVAAGALFGKVHPEGVWPVEYHA
ncbi:MAG: hypothetical protein HFG26_10710 [Provencibacterium sp.]|jgi:beta-N-acetylhexosaminidase|nr:hypothetical protein [Provencibacterium sp.]